MKKEVIAKTISFQCDSCGKEYTDEKEGYSLEFLDEVGEKSFAKLRNNDLTARRQLSAFGNRKIVDFCGRECALKYMNTQMEVLLKETKPIIKPKRVSMF